MNNSPRELAQKYLSLGGKRIAVIDDNVGSTRTWEEDPPAAATFWDTWIAVLPERDQRDVETYLHSLNDESDEPASRQAAFYEELARKHDATLATVEHLYSALEAGGGNIAEFSLTEFNATGTWTPNGLSMLGDRLNADIKAKVDALCRELSVSIKSGSPSEPEGEMTL